ncbi:MAG: hypothetical protein HOP02_11160 [Methylococcaceae bacterium]|nr:hypothetical protein [Methylococcaceae bacterium]
MKITKLTSYLMILTLTGCANHPVKTEPLVMKKVVYSSNAVISEAIRNECDLPNILSTFIKTAAESQYPHIMDDTASTDAQAEILSVEITHVEGAAGGAWTGLKSVAINATLTKQGRAIGDFKAARISNNVALLGVGSIGGTCGILRHCIKTLSGDVAKWLENPTPNAVLK